MKGSVIVQTFVLVVLADICSLYAWAQDSKRVDLLQFNRDVRPILADHCYACHGPDAHSRKAKLRLDKRESALGENDAGSAIVPGKPEQSELVFRIESDDDDELMPPPKFHKPLTMAEKKILVRWIGEGAKYEKHWSFEQPKASKPPKTNYSSKVINPIDSFVFKRMEEQELIPSNQASRETLIRRVTLDLTGLPPTPSEIHTFSNDRNDNAYEKLVDRLMGTTAYAERRAQDWLDLARYADTRGFADDKMRNIWPWRDWVIQSFHENMPFDQFTIEQLAGDMLPKATPDQLLATGFHRNAPQAKGMTYPVEEYRIKGVIDRVNVIGRVWFGLTLDCAECHDHKFDPITQRDYYSILALFNNIEHRGSGFGQGGPTMNYKLPAPKLNFPIESERKLLKQQLVAARKAMPKPSQIKDEYIIGKWENSTVEVDPQKYSITHNLTISAKIRTKQTVADLVSKYDWRGKQRGYVFGIGGEGDKGSLPGHLFFWVSSRAESFNGITVYGSQPVNDGKEHLVAVEFVAGKSVRLFIDGIEDKAARVSGRPPAFIARSNRPLAIGSGYNGSSKANAYRFEGELSEVHLSDQAVGDQLAIGVAGKKIYELQTRLLKLDDQKGDPKIVDAVPVMRERAKPRETFVHIRGSFLNKGDQVSPAVPELFELPESYHPRNRLEFARWLTGGKNPLVARVAVNRFWQSYFGHGLVRTPDDFGAQGTSPSHPKLLDWLAIEFAKSGWDMKHINRLIVTSATYRQSARILPEVRKLDPENLWLSHMPRVRLPAEQIRDQALAISGLLNQKTGGAPVFPLQTPDYWEKRVLPGKWKNSQGMDRYRRTIYTYWRRMALHPTLELLNAPARDNCVVRRNVSNVPTQALALMNDPIFSEAASVFAKRLLQEINSDEEKRLQQAFRLALGRSPKEEEKNMFLNYLEQQGKALAKDDQATKKIADNQKLAVWTLACSVLLNLDETVTRP
ncbi:MAG: DUF1553 domain-containing protein [Opitutae bacterium]|nr:DUF1553 domain-containing protein [Opitutae bacterium]MBT6461319.1 DUF1553 domain-containing protein [Opitutae bacterium]